MTEIADRPTTEAPTPAQAHKPQAPAKGDKDGLGISFDDSTPGVQRVHLSRNDIVCALFHTKDPAQASVLLAHCLRTVRVDEAAGDVVNDDRGFLASVVRDIAPRDVVERMLAVQMATTHTAVMRAARRMASADHLSQIEAHTTAHTKLSRTFVAQMEALKRHRSKGQQVVRVERVNVEPGGQAIVGEVHHGGRGAGHES